MGAQRVRKEVRMHENAQMQEEYKKDQPNRFDLTQIFFRLPPR